MKVQNGKWKIASRDIWHATCEHCTRLSMAIAAGSTWAKDSVKGFEESGEKLQFLQGNDYEALRFAEIKASLPDGDFIEMPKFATKEQTQAQLDLNIPVIAQAYLEVDYGFCLLTGYADLLVREDYELEFIRGKLTATKTGSDSNKYYPVDIKHAKAPKPFYWHQVAGYLEALTALGLSSTKPVGVVTKSAVHRQDNVTAISNLTAARTDLFDLLLTTSIEDAKQWTNIALHCAKTGDCDTIYCEYPKLCIHDRARLDLFTQLSNNGIPVATKLAKVGITTLQQLLEAKDPIDDVDPTDLSNLQLQAQLVRNEAEGVDPRVVTIPGKTVTLPNPSPGDIFFDLEWFNPLLGDKELQYVFGTVNYKGEYKAFEAQNLEQERQAFASFVDYCLTMIHHHPDMHIYHWHNPEATYLKKLAEYHNLFKEDVAKILTYMVDLKKVAVGSIYVGTAAYGLKVLERYYSKQNDDSQVNRNTDTSHGADSMVQFYKFQKALEANDKALARTLLADIIEYNKADCVSTLEAFNLLRGMIHQN